MWVLFPPYQAQDDPKGYASFFWASGKLGKARLPHSSSGDSKQAQIRVHFCSIPSVDKELPGQGKLPIATTPPQGQARPDLSPQARRNSLGAGPEWPGCQVALSTPWALPVTFPPPRPGARIPTQFLTESQDYSGISLGRICSWQGTGSPITALASCRLVLPALSQKLCNPPNSGVLKLGTANVWGCLFAGGWCDLGLSCIL